MSLSGWCILESSWAQASLHKINSSSGPYFPRFCFCLFPCASLMRLWVFLLWHGANPLKVPFSSLPPLFIYLRQDLKCSSAKRPSSSRFSFLVLPSVELEAFTNIPGHLFILSYVPLLPQLCSHLSVDMPFPLWNLADIWAAMSYIALPLSCVPHSLHSSIQLSKNLLYELVYVILSGLTILGDHPSSSDFKKLAGVQYMLAIQELLFY